MPTKISFTRLPVRCMRHVQVVYFWWAMPTLVRLRVYAAREVKDRSRENAFHPVTDHNCVTVR